MHIRGGFIRAQIKSAQRDQLAGQSPERGAIGRILRVFGGPVLAFQIQKLAAQQPHALGIAGLQRGQIGHAPNVGKQRHALPVGGLSGLAAIAFQKCGLPGQRTGALRIRSLPGLVGVQHNAACAAVQQGGAAVPVRPGLGAKDQRNAHAARQNGHVALRAALLQHHAQQKPLRQADGLPGKQLPGGQYGRAAEGGGRAALNGSRQLFAQLGHILAALAHIVIVQRGKQSPHFPHAKARGLGGGLALLDIRPHIFLQVFLQQHSVQFKNGCGFLACLLLCCLIQLRLTARAILTRKAEFFQLLRRGALGRFAAGCFGKPNHASLRQPRRSGPSAELLHLCIPPLTGSARCSAAL